jgi:hypothetical protein
MNCAICAWREWGDAILERNINRGLLWNILDEFGIAKVVLNRPKTPRIPLTDLNLPLIFVSVRSPKQTRQGKS